VARFYEWNIILYQGIMFTFNLETVCEDTEVRAPSFQNLMKVTEGGYVNVIIAFIRKGSYSAWSNLSCCH